MLRNKWIAMLTVILVVAMVSGCGKGSGQETKEDKQVVATYKEGKVTKSEFDKFKKTIGFFNPQFEQYAEDPSIQENILKQIIAYKILNDRADKEIKEDGEKKAKEQLEEIKGMIKKQQGAAQGAQPESLESLLKKLNITEEDVVSFLQLDETARLYMGKKVTDMQIKSEYDKNLKADKDYYTTATVSHILIKTKDPATGKESRKKANALKLAKEVKSKLDAGGNFAELAKKYSEDEGSKNNGGTYKDAQITQWVPAFKKAASTLPLNKISDPVETEYGYHIIKVEARTVKKLEDVKEQLRDTVSGQQMSEFVQKELPGLITNINLPKPPAQPKQDEQKTNPTTPKPQTDQKQPANPESGQPDTKNETNLSNK